MLYKSSYSSFLGLFILLSFILFIRYILIIILLDNLSYHIYFSRVLFQYISGLKLTPRLQESVYILFTYVSSVWRPVGTAFAISSRHVLTARHCILDDKSNVPSICIARCCTSSEIFAPIRMLIHSSSIENDWAILILEGEMADNFPSFLDIATVDRLPEKDAEVRALFAPISLMLEGSMLSLEISVENYSRITHYGLNSPLTTFDEFKGLSLSTVNSAPNFRQNPDAVLLNVSGGLTGGSCGSPYIDRSGFVVAMHLFSANESVSIPDAIARYQRNTNKKQKTSTLLDSGAINDVLSDASDSFCSFKQGLVLCKVSDFVVAYHNITSKVLNSKFIIEKGN